ncbi:MAG: hypothetical protein U9Q80_10180 [Bacillota bacterium]|nr:hypothetical protein [Bacillota bacterium]
MDFSKQPNKGIGDLKKHIEQVRKRTNYNKHIVVVFSEATNYLRNKLIEEILSRKPSILTEREPGSIIPMILEEKIVSLSAILLNKEYYQFIMNLRFEIDGMIVADERCLIPLKARAWLDLKQRKQAVRTKDIKKHKNDIYRMTQLLTNTSIEHGFMNQAL